MKKTILLLLTTIVFVSCSKNDDNSEKQLNLTFQNMSGVWNFKSYIKPNGETVNYVGQSATLIDHAEILPTAKITTSFYYPNGVAQIEPCYGYYFDGNRIKNCLQVFDDARVTSLTSTSMKLEYDTPRSFGTIYGDGAKALILTK